MKTGIVSREAWLRARLELLDDEKALQRARDEAMAQLDAELMRYLVDLGNRPPRIIDLV